MDIEKSIQQLDDRAIESIISHLTGELSDQSPPKNQDFIKSEEEATAAISDFLNSNGISVDSSTPLIKPEYSRPLLLLFWEDKDLRPRVEELIANPPVDNQRSVEVAMSSAIILGGLIGWLQSKIEIKIARKDGKFEFSFHLLKNKTKDSIISDVVSSVTKVIAGADTKK